MLKQMLTRLIVGFVCAMVAVVASATTLTVTSPTDGAYIGQSNSLTFTITGASVQVTVKAVVTGSAGSTTITNKFTPDTSGNISSSLPLNFSNSSPEGDYTIVASATEPGKTYTDVTVHVHLIVNPPKFLDWSPLDGQFVKGIVPINLTIQSAYVKDWTVQVNSQDIPNNTGSGNTISVNWDTSSIQTDGSQSITITVHDLAENTLTKTLNVTLDRVAPTVTIVYPSSSVPVVAASDISVIVDVKAESTSAVNVTGVDIVAKRLDGSFITLVGRISYSASGSTNTNRWIGRIRYRRGLLPQTFLLVANAVDRAGNVAAQQQIQVRVGR